MYRVGCCCVEAGGWWCVEAGGWWCDEAGGLLEGTLDTLFLGQTISVSNIPCFNRLLKNEGLGCWKNPNI